MGVDHNDLMEIQRVFDERYVKQNTCDDRQAEINKKFANDDKRLELLKHDLSLFKKIAYIIMSAAIGQLVISIFDLLKGL